MENNKLNGQESLKLINEMISQAKNNIQIGSADSMIRSGYTVSAVALLNIILIYTLDKPYHSFWAWLLMIPVSIIDYFIDRKKDKSAIVKTHIDTIISKTWKAFGCCVCLILLSIFGMGYIMNTWLFSLLIMPSILAFAGFGVYITGVASKYPAFIKSACTLWTGAILCTLLLAFAKEHYAAGQFVILIVCMISGFCIPGHILNKKAKNQHV